MALSGMESANFRLVEKCLDLLLHRVPSLEYQRIGNSSYLQKCLTDGGNYYTISKYVYFYVLLMLF